MRAITVHQPWASLIVYGLKTFETRSWAHRYRGLVAIHAGRHWNEDSKIFTQHLMAKYPEIASIGNELPLGAVIGVAKLVGIYRAEELRLKLGFRESDLGDFGDGRFGWHLETPEIYKTPLFCKGQQGLWEWDGQGISDEFYGRVR